MGYNFRDYNPNQLLLLAPNLDDWLPQQHLARFIVPAHTLWTFSMKCPLFSNGSRHCVCQAHYV